MSFMALERDGIVYARDLVEAGDDPRYLRLAAERGELVRIRRGAYCRRTIWDESDARARHVLHARAVMRTAPPGALVAGSSAAAVWVLPAAARWPGPVTLLVPDRGGGTSIAGARLTSIGHAGAESATVAGIDVTTRARTAVDIARVQAFADGVAVIDAVRDRRRPDRVAEHDLWRELAELGSVRGSLRAARAIAFSTDKAESAGESRARVAIHRLGYAAPELQREFVDSQGSMFPDFYWPSVAVAVEFDGMVKYTDQTFTDGDPSQVVWREKKREDRLRRLVSRVDRIITSEVERPRLLDRILFDAGVPFRPGARPTPLRR